MQNMLVILQISENVTPLHYRQFGVIQSKLTLEYVGHFTDLGEGGSVTPGIDHVHHVRFEGRHVFLFIHLKLGLNTDARDSSGRVLVGKSNL